MPAMDLTRTIRIGTLSLIFLSVVTTILHQWHQSVQKNRSQSLWQQFEHEHEALDSEALPLETHRRRRHLNNAPQQKEQRVLGADDDWVYLNQDDFYYSGKKAQGDKNNGGGKDSTTPAPIMITAPADPTNPQVVTLSPVADSTTRSPQVPQPTDVSITTAPVDISAPLPTLQVSLPAATNPPVAAGTNPPISSPPITVTPIVVIPATPVPVSNPLPAPTGAAAQPTADPPVLVIAVTDAPVAATPEPSVATTTDTPTVMPETPAPSSTTTTDAPVVTTDAPVVTTDAPSSSDTGDAPTLNPTLLAATTTGLAEVYGCLKISQVPLEVWFHSDTDAVCLSNDCSDALRCCRFHAEGTLKCDDTNANPENPCLCHDFTKDPTTLPASPLVADLPEYTMPPTVETTEYPTIAETPTAADTESPTEAMTEEPTVPPAEETINPTDQPTESTTVPVAGTPVPTIPVELPQQETEDPTDGTTDAPTVADDVATETPTAPEPMPSTSPIDETPAPTLAMTLTQEPTAAAPTAIIQVEEISLPQDLPDQANVPDRDVLKEPEPCLPFDQASPLVFHPRTEALCKTNECNDGCCRIRNWLICDRDNEFSDSPCVCNENTATDREDEGPGETVLVDVEIDASETDAVESNAVPHNNATDPLDPDVCVNGSPLYDVANFASFTQCARSAECAAMDATHCCLVSYCMCGAPLENATAECVPPFELPAVEAFPSESITASSTTEAPTESPAASATTVAPTGIPTTGRTETPTDAAVEVTKAPTDSPTDQIDDAVANDTDDDVDSPCANGSVYQTMSGFSQFQSCVTSADCGSSPTHCCLERYCLCAPPQKDAQEECVPPFGVLMDEPVTAGRDHEGTPTGQISLNPSAPSPSPVATIKPSVMPATGSPVATIKPSVLQPTKPLVEKVSCEDFGNEDAMATRMDHPNSDSVCLTNSCSLGCCRFYWWFVCDENNDFPNIPCVCNENTQDPENFVPNDLPSVAAAVTSTPTALMGEEQQVTSIPTAEPTTPTALMGEEQQVTSMPTAEPSIEADVTTPSPTTSPGDLATSIPAREPSVLPPMKPLVEKVACKDFGNEDAMSTRMDHPNSDSVCLTNSCSQGCCRFYWWFVCDENNDFPNIPCVCNENTQDPEKFVPDDDPPAAVAVTSTPTTSMGEEQQVTSIPTAELSIEADVTTPSPTTSLEDLATSVPTEEPIALPPMNPLIETEACRELGDDMQSRTNHPNSDPVCLTNSCSRGCCRVYWWFVCDENNDFKHIPCVCNDNTQDPESFVPNDHPAEVAVTSTPTALVGEEYQLTSIPTVEPSAKVVTPSHPTAVLSATPTPTEAAGEELSIGPTTSSPDATSAVEPTSVRPMKALIERVACRNFEEDLETRMDHPSSDQVCLTNSCNHGCCRVYWWFVCDEDNEFSFVPCVCNENTQDPNNFVKYEEPDDSVEPHRICQAGTIFHNLAGYEDHTKCFGDSDCGGDECCLSQSCLCGKPDGEGSCVPPDPSAVVQVTRDMDNGKEEVDDESSVRMGADFPTNEPTLSPADDSTSVHVVEKSACVPFEGDAIRLANHPNTDEACRTNSCSNGCCRIYHWLLCDESNDLALSPCVCNENTIDPANFPDDDGVVEPPIDVAPEDVCREGSIYQTLDSFSEMKPCFNGDECDAGQCCLSSYCLCGVPSNSTAECVPIPDPPPTEAHNDVEVESIGLEPQEIPPVDACLQGVDVFYSDPSYAHFTQCVTSNDCPTIAGECCLSKYCMCGPPSNEESAMYECVPTSDEEETTTVAVSPGPTAATSEPTGSPTETPLIPLEETVACVPFDGSVLVHADHPNTHETCKTNSCGGGCCRSYWWLLCDETNAFKFAPCICNENTQDPANFQPPPTPPPVPLGPTDVCNDGSDYHGHPSFSALTPCYGADGCGEGGCCMKKFCFCGTSNDPEKDCVPDAFDSFLDAVEVVEEVSIPEETFATLVPTSLGTSQPPAPSESLTEATETSATQVPTESYAESVTTSPTDSVGTNVTPSPTESVATTTLTLSPINTDPVPTGVAPSPTGSVIETSVTVAPSTKQVHVIEQVACVQFAGNVLHHAEHANSDESCKTNTCPNGCCRSYWWLLCDEDNAYTFAPCICNENTQDPQQFVSNKPVRDTPAPQSLVSTNPDACKDGSPFHHITNFDHLTRCFDGQGCGEGECCVTAFCLCMKPDSLDECLVPVPEGVVVNSNV
ncbi:Polymorphic outer membrane protein [Seminavis robusta]|uniref:Polymorphic outer membrane protein n=1 Tax=Seminavis robusta TaxID=568900 RepID=A0A9N8HQC7_9STRA|nr:Polymorphic outer membrane protein [Seminavis robusta]|eukprot:Sro1273_g258300.1 Polymorphic outer membrane protein (2210) ;mRNA; r:6583-13212